LGSLQEVQSAFSNLVSNAVRYTPEGGQILLIWSEHDGQPLFSVTDTGEGIASEHIPRLTERFYRVDRSRSRETGGTGLGLAIVKHILTRHGARLDIQSIPGKGSTFSAIFPEARLIFSKNEDQKPRLALVK
jgi:two-component system phosphate regulon sensor histidine kinase PhoR